MTFKIHKAAFFVRFSIGDKWLSKREIGVDETDLIIGIEHTAYFYTATILNWNHLLKNDQYKRYITDSLKFLVEDKRIYVYGFTIMPNHIHLCMSIREGYELSTIKNSFMKFTAQRMKLDMLRLNDPALENFISTQQDRAWWQIHPSFLQT